MKKDNFSNWMGAAGQVIPAMDTLSIEHRIAALINQKAEEYMNSEEFQERVNAAVSDRVSDVLTSIDVESLIKDNLEAWRNANHKSK